MSSPYEIYDGQIGVKLGYVLNCSKAHDESVALISYSAYEKRARRNQHLRLRSGGGLGNHVLLNWSHLPSPWKKALKKKFGQPDSDDNPLIQFFSLSGDARRYFDDFAFAPGEHLAPAQKKLYTLNASVLDALNDLKKSREVARKMRSISLRGLWPSLISDLETFNGHLMQTVGMKHTLPCSRKIKDKLDDYIDQGYSSLVDGRAKNKSAQVVTPLMIQIWGDIFAGQRYYNPDYTEVWKRYCAFLAGACEVVIAETGEAYDPTSPEFKKVSRQTVYKYQSSWQYRAPASAIREGDRQVYISKHEVPHNLDPPKFAGTLISIDDRNPPFKELGTGKRIWFYNCLDVASLAITVWVYGRTKEGIILEFYRQMVRNYHEWGLKLPLELECESSLNSSYKDTLLAPGAMFQKVRIIPNNARGKRVEAFYKPLRYQYEKKREGWLARPHAKDEANRASREKVPEIPYNEIVEGCLKDIETINNEKHHDQDLYPGMTRWDVFLDRQNPALDKYDYNWPAILSGLGKTTKTSMKVGHIAFQGKKCLVGIKGEPALGKDLIAIMNIIEGKEVEVKWLDGNDGEVISALVYHNGRMVCDLLGDFKYNRSEFERTEEGDRNRQIQSAYAATVRGYIKSQKKKINKVAIIENEQEDEKPKRFKIRQSPVYVPSNDPVKTLTEPTMEDFETDLEDYEETNTSTISRFS